MYASSNVRFRRITVIVIVIVKRHRSEKPPKGAPPRRNLDRQTHTHRDTPAARQHQRPRGTATSITPTLPYTPATQAGRQAATPVDHRRLIVKCADAPATRADMTAQFHQQSPASGLKKYAKTDRQRTAHRRKPQENPLLSHLPPSRATTALCPENAAVVEKTLL